ncbi:MAG: glycosyltransferase family 2 protein, partial [Lachnospiraceae bacterium]|nr:glycosyltransferase family 2 protein [Lachnospiraceae bacterium]
ADARVEHYHNYTGMQQLRRNFDLGVSQKDHPEVFENISSEKEGASLVKNTVKELFRMKKPFGVFRLVYLSGMKYVGYRLGKAYRRLPKGLVRMLSMNKNYWR